MADIATNEQVEMASLNVAKQQLRSAMKQKLNAVSHDSIVSQSTN
jgi:5-formyltetrahydrofolate cyclo-ligase